MSKSLHWKISIATEDIQICTSHHCHHQRLRASARLERRKSVFRWEGENVGENCAKIAKVGKNVPRLDLDSPIAKKIKKMKINCRMRNWSLWNKNCLLWSNLMCNFWVLFIWYCSLIFDVLYPNVFGNLITEIFIIMVSLKCWTG